MGCTRHMISEGIHIPKAMGVHSDQVFGCDFGCNWKRPLGTGQMWSGPISVVWGAQGGDDGVNPEEMGMNKCDLALGTDCDTLANSHNFQSMFKAGQLL